MSVLPILPAKWRSLPILEGAVEKKASNYAETIGYIAIKVSPVGQRGWPDHVFINVYGHHVYIEFKKLGESPSKLQFHRLKQLQERGVAAYWTDNYEQAKSILDANVDTTRLSN